MESLPQDKKILLFDGYCLLCDCSVQWIIKHDKRGVFRFISMQSPLGQDIVRTTGADPSQIESVILYHQGVYLNKAAAVFAIAKEIGGCYALLGVFSLLPICISNAVYDYIARNRYKWFGKKQTCTLPSSE